MAHRLRNLVGDALALGAKRAAYRAVYEIANQSGLRALVEPIGQIPHPTDTPDYATWFSELPDEHWFRHLRRQAHNGVERSDAVVARADAATRGRIRCFSDATWDYAPNGAIEWHYDPTQLKRWPHDVHWSAALAANVGDVKWVWELSRFPHAFDLADAYAMTGDASYASAFGSQLLSWDSENPYRAGVNWASGQELALRLMAWSYAVATFGDVLNEEVFRCFARQAEWHARHIADQLGFARNAVPNNHLIGEAVALIMVGTAFRHFDQSEAWFELGRRTLKTALETQFHDDGGYCQASHTYHRLALRYLLWADRFLDSSDRLAGSIRRVFRNSVKYFKPQLVVAGDALRLPNYGPNDGTYLGPFPNTDYEDFHPVITEIGGRTKTRDGHTVLETSGLATLREGSLLVVMRCGTPTHPWGHADQLHVDIWHEGHNVAGDAGSFSYTGDEHDLAMSTAMHNTVVVEDADQSRRHRHFTWADPPEASLTHADDQCLVGFHDGYRQRFQTRHTRSVTLHDESVVIEDHLSIRSAESRSCTLHWLLPGEWKAKNEVVTNGRIQLEIDADVELAPGWISTRYGRKEPATRVFATRESNDAVRFLTRVSWS